MKTNTAVTHQRNIVCITVILNCEVKFAGMATFNINHFQQLYKHKIMKIMWLVSIYIHGIHLSFTDGLCHCKLNFTTSPIVQNLHCILFCKAKK